MLKCSSHWSVDYLLALDNKYGPPEQLFKSSSKNGFIA